MNDHDPLAEELTRDSGLDRLQFSESLHARVMASIRPRPMLITRPAWIRWATAAAATIAIAIGTVLLTRPRPQPIAVNKPVVLPAIGNPLAAMLRPAADRLGAVQYAYVDRDARRAVAYLVDQLSIRIPSERETPRPVKEPIRNNSQM